MFPFTNKHNSHLKKLHDVNDTFQNNILNFQ